jgi:hypothetical protein
MRGRSFEVSVGHALYVSPAAERLLAIHAAVDNIIKRGGHVLLFGSRAVRNNPWVKIEVEHAKATDSGRVY